jgi:HKD family nuclease
MKLKFIGQGVDPDNNVTTGDVLLDSFEETGFKSFRAFVAFASVSGINNLLEKLNEFRAAGGAVKLFVGVDLHSTSKEALQLLMDEEIETVIVYSPNNVIYHPKVYAFEGDDNSRVLIGSSNLTARGLFQSMEATVCVSVDNNEDEDGVAFIADIYAHYNEIINGHHASAQELSPDLLNILVVNKVVLPEGENRAKQNKINKEYSKTPSDSKHGLLEAFSKIKLRRPPKGYKKVVEKNEVEVSDDDEVSVNTEEIEIQTNSMWIETRKMTGGSMNQLDISKKGKLNGVQINGSVSFFGIDPDDPNDSVDINLELGGKNYKVNPVEYRPGNSNWRLLLKGETDDGDKLTTVSRAKLGDEGGFVNKILLFTRLGGNSYKLEILDQIDIEILKENSTTWGFMGNETTGRAYGFT